MVNSPQIFAVTILFSLSNSDNPSGYSDGLFNHSILQPFNSSLFRGEYRSRTDDLLRARQAL